MASGYKSYLLHDTHTHACLHTCIIRPTLASSVWLWIPTAGFPSTPRKSSTCFVAGGEPKCRHTSLPSLMGRTVTCFKVSPCWNCKSLLSDQIWQPFVFFPVFRSRQPVPSDHVGYEVTSQWCHWPYLCRPTSNYPILLLLSARTIT